MCKAGMFLLILIVLVFASGAAGAQDYGAAPLHAFVAFYEGGLQVFDVSDPWNPEGIANCDTPRHEALDIAVRDDYAYLADGHGGFQIYNISDPTEIGEPATFLRPCNARDISLDGDYAFIAAENSIQIYNIAGPEDAFWVTTYEVDIKYDQDIFATGGYAYVACGVEGLRMLDVSVPADAYEVGHIIPRGMARAVAVAGDFAYVAAGAAGLQVINVSDPSDPAIVGEGIYTGDATWGICIEGNLAYVADRNYGVRIIDISNPGELVEVGSFRVTRGRADDIFVYGGFAFVAAHSGDLQILDVTDPANPAQTAWVRWPGNARAVAVIG